MMTQACRHRREDEAHDAPDQKPYPYALVYAHVYTPVYTDVYGCRVVDLEAEVSAKADQLARLERTIAELHESHGRRPCLFAPFVDVSSHKSMEHSMEHSIDPSTDGRLEARCDDTGVSQVS